MPGKPGTIDRLIINSPYEEPRQHWRSGDEDTVDDTFGEGDEDLCGPDSPWP